MNPIDASLIDAFTQEVKENVEILEASLILLETNASNKEWINKVFRAVHSVKGSSGFLGLENVSKLSHSI